MAPTSPTPMALAAFHPLVAEWFGRAFAAPTEAQTRGWPAIAAGHHALILAPTGSGKTLAAFLWALNQLVTSKLEGRQVERVLYVSPLKALNYDVERNLSGPLAGLTDAARRQGLELPEISVAVRTGDTPQIERQRMLRRPPDILITTPESLYLMLTSRGREVLVGARTIILDEIHAVAATKRGAHMALSLERLDDLVTADGGSLQRIGLSATQRPLSEIARFLGGQDSSGSPRPVEVIDAGSTKELDLEVIVPVDDMSDLATSGPDPVAAADYSDVAGSESQRRSIWPAMYPQLLELVRAHRSTLIFVNNRRLAERLALRLNELAEQEVARAHHGSLAREQRTIIEQELKAGRLPALVATSSLELGIDMGAVDLVIQVESPRSVARGIQRVGRAGHHVGAASRGRIFPKYRGDLLECAAVVARMHSGEIEHSRVPRQPLDVLAQQIVAMCADAEWPVADLHALVRGAYPYSELSREQLDGVLDMLSGRYPSDEMAELRPRIVWDRGTDIIRGRPGARQLAVQNAGTIPDRGLYGVYLGDGSSRVGELDEEMVYEARPGQTFMLGASTWRIEEITRDRVIVSPAPGAPGAVPFWRGEGVGRPAELGAAVGKLTRELLAATPDDARARLRAESDFDERAAENLVSYVHDQAEATGTVPSDRAIVVERFRDEIGDWRLCVLTPYGARVHAPWAMAIGARIRETTGQEAHTIWTDDGIAVHFPEADSAPSADLVMIAPDELDELVIGELGGTALFGSRFRENAARSLLIPRRRPGQRTPLWQQRLKASSLLQVTRQYGSFPVILETYRECLDDWFDLPALRDLLGRVESRHVSVVEAETASASPFASSLLFAYVASYMYEGDAPVAERRAHALALDRDLLRELLGRDELRELIDPGALESVEADLQGTSERAQARSADTLHDLLRRIGDLTLTEVTARITEPSEALVWLEQLASERRACAIRLAGEDRWIATDDAARYRDGLGVMPPAGLPDAYLEPVDAALAGLVARWTRARGPFHASELADRFSITREAAEAELARLETSGSLVRGEIRPGGSGHEWCDADVLRRLRRASLAALRKEVEATEPQALGRFLPAWHGIDRSTVGAGPERLREIIGPLQGLALPAAQWESEVFPRRLGSYSPSWLDQLAAAGEIVWLGAGGGSGGGRVALYIREDAAVFGPPHTRDDPPDDPLAVAVREALGDGASFWDDLVDIVDAPREEIFAALWSLVWAGEATNDLWAPLRAPRRLPALVNRNRPGVRPSIRRSSRSGLAAVSGRWSLTERLMARAPTPTDKRRALAELLLERHGVLTRGAVIGDGIAGGFSGVYSEFVALETLGVARRGYFVEGLGGAQFALPGAVERMRDLRGRPGEITSPPLVLGAADPAQPYGASVPWPATVSGRTPGRSFGAQVVLVDGAPTLYLERGGRSLVTFAEPDTEAQTAALTTLAEWVRADRSRKLLIERVDGTPIGETGWGPRLADAGFRTDLRGMLLRA